LYLDYFGLTDPPFRITPNTDYWFEGGQRGDLLATLVYAITHGEGLIKVVGEVGSGKTMLCRMLQQQLPEYIDTVYLGNPTLQPDEILVTILSDLGVTGTTAGNRQILLDQLNNALLSRHSSGRRVVAFVEEAQGMTLESLEFMRLLTNLETASDKLLQIVLFGQPELDQTLADPRIRQFKDRITLNLTLPPLSENDTRNYLRSRLQVAGYRGPDLFSDTVVRNIARLSGGLSRRINILADKTLLAAYGEKTHNISVAHVKAAAKDAEMAAASSPRLKLRRWGWAMAGVTAGLSLLAYLSWYALGVQATPALPLPLPAAKTTIPLQPVTATPVEPAMADASIPDSANWIKNAPASTFVIQVLTAKDANEASALLEGKHGQLPQPLRGFRARTPKGLAWVVVAGEYQNRQTALIALSGLPPELRTSEVFLRTAGKIRATLPHEETRT
jgi:type II secretory pathway predicted ATPase ExeA